MKRNEAQITSENFQHKFDANKWNFSANSPSAAVLWLMDLAGYMPVYKAGSPTFPSPTGEGQDEGAFGPSRQADGPRV
jgi:hypothetical protein